MSKLLFSGVNLAITTPFDQNGKIDFNRYDELIELYLAAGITSFVLSSGTGMHAYLSEEESKSLIAHGAKAINGRARVIAQTSALLTQDVINRVRHAADCGASGVMVLPPFFEGPTDDEGVISFYSDVATAGLPIIGYNVPQAVGVNIGPDLLARLCQIPEFVGVKDSSGDLASQTSLIQTGLPVINGADPFMPFSLLAGVSGLIWGGANFAPKSAVKLVKLAQAEDWTAVKQLWKSLQPAMNLIWESEYVRTVYAAADIVGYSSGTPRKPFSKLPALATERLHEALEPLISLEKI